MKRVIIAVILLIWVAAICPVSGKEESLTVLSNSPDGAAPGKLLELFLKGEFEAHLDRRREAFEELDGPAACRKWAADRKTFFEKQLGGFPKRTPMNAQIVGELQGEGYRVEKILFESRPSHHVTGNLYLPESEGPFPVVLIPCGHSHNGKASGWYQRMGILLARNGMAGFCYDPIGQGERYQALDFEHEHETFPSVSYQLAVPHPRVRFLCTTEHTFMGLGCILLGSNVAQYRIWDGMRAIDYLQSRDDIIGDKIGCTGNSGGGTLTAYLMALDDRITAAAPGCYLTTFRRLIETKGPQDAEQNIFGQIAFGMDEPDYLMMRAPKPTLILASTRDSTFDIGGAWDLFRQSKRFYNRLGYPERVDLSEPDVPHGMYPQHREAAARFMHRWLLDKETDIREFDWATLPDPISDEELRELSKGDWTQEELYCSPEGQVLLMEGEKSVFQLNAEREAALRENRSIAWAKKTDEEKRNQVREMIGATESPAAKVERLPGSIMRDGYVIEKLILTPGSKAGIPLPAVAFMPESPNGEVTLYLHGESMAADAQPGGPIENLVMAGHTVISAELRGIGETETGHDKRDWGRGRFGRDVSEIFLGYLIGRSYVGMRVEDVEMWTAWLRSEYLEDPKEGKLHLVAAGEAVIPALHSAALKPDSFSSVTLSRMIPAWVEVVKQPESSNQLVNVVHGALRFYDLPDLIRLAGGKEKITVEDPVDVLGQPVDPN